VTVLLSVYSETFRTTQFLSVLADPRTAAVNTHKTVAVSRWLGSNRKMSNSFRVTVWDPPLIISQIVAVQCIMYISLGLWIILLLHFMGGHPVSIDYIFRYQVGNVKRFMQILCLT